MPKDLKITHKENDELVRNIYGNKWGKDDEQGCINYLLQLYKKLCKTVPKLK